VMKSDLSKRSRMIQDKEMEKERNEFIKQVLIDNQQGEDDCTCGLKWRDMLGTEQTMHQAWRKRAEEAEIKINTLTAELEALRKENAELKERLERVHDLCDNISGLAVGYDALDSKDGLKGMISTMASWARKGLKA
jgi:predicted RNase H-like nuclease (RuvC/YqgF family)